MKSVVVSFPDITIMAEFILRQKLSHVQTDSKAITITGILSDDQIAKAYTVYGGDILKMAGIATK